MPCPDPVISELSPDRHFGSVTEAFFSSVHDYVQMNPDDELHDGSDRYGNEVLAYRCFVMYIAQYVISHLYAVIRR